MKNALFCFLLPLVSMAQTPVIYNLPDANLNSRTICGKNRVCDPGPQRGIVYRFAKNPYSPDIDNNSTPQSIAASILGQAVAASQINSEELNICSADGMTSLITLNDVTSTGGYGVAGRSLDYKKQKKLNINPKVSAEANIGELMKKGVTRQTLIDSLKTELEAVYNKLKDNQLVITANYSEWALKSPVINKIKNAPEFQPCRDKIKQKGWAFITDIGLITYSISTGSETVRKFGTNIDAKLKREGLDVEVGTLIESEVHKFLTSNLAQGYQVIGWRKMLL